MPMLKRPQRSTLNFTKNASSNRQSNVNESAALDVDGDEDFINSSLVSNSSISLSGPEVSDSSFKVPDVGYSQSEEIVLDSSSSSEQGVPSEKYSPNLLKTSIPNFWKGNYLTKENVFKHNIIMREIKKAPNISCFPSEDTILNVSFNSGQAVPSASYSHNLPIKSNILIPSFLKGNPLAKENDLMMQEVNAEEDIFFNLRKKDQTLREANLKDENQISANKENKKINLRTKHNTDEICSDYNISDLNESSSSSFQNPMTEPSTKATHINFINEKKMIKYNLTPKREIPERDSFKTPVGEENNAVHNSETLSECSLTDLNESISSSQGSMNEPSTKAAYINFINNKKITPSPYSMNEPSVKAAYINFINERRMSKFNITSKRETPSKNSFEAPVNNENKIISLKTIHNESCVDYSITDLNESVSSSSQGSMNEPSTKAAYFNFINDKKMTHSPLSMNEPSAKAAYIDFINKKDITKYNETSKRELLEKNSFPMAGTEICKGEVTFSENESLSSCSQYSMNEPSIKQAYINFINNRKVIPRFSESVNFCAQDSRNENSMKRSKKVISDVSNSTHIASRSQNSLKTPLIKKGAKKKNVLHKSTNRKSPLSKNSVKRLKKSNSASIQTSAKSTLINDQHVNKKSIISNQKRKAITSRKESKKNKTKKKRVSELPKNVSHRKKLLLLQEQRNVGVYVHCDNCNKLRYLEHVKDPTELPSLWYCNMNPDRNYNSCQIPEVPLDETVKEELIDNLYNAGSIVWGRLDGYPWWPALVDDDPNTECFYWLDDEFTNIPTWYHVTFFDSKVVKRAWLKPKCIKPFLENIDYFNSLPLKYKKYKNRIDIATTQATLALKMDLLSRLRTFGFVVRYKKAIISPKQVDICQKSKLAKDKKTEESNKKNKAKKNNFTDSDSSSQS